jgi:hypothetical protein
MSKEYTTKDYADMILCGKTIRETASITGFSRSWIHRVIHDKLSKECPELYKAVQEKLNENFANKHLKGGETTHLLWKQKREEGKNG